MENKINQTPIISVVIPVFNRLKLFEKTLLSLKNQSFPFNLFEVIVVDDGSTDKIQEKILEMKVTLPYKILYAYQINQGPAVARNRGVELSQAEIIAFTDSDVIVDQHWLKKGYEQFCLEPTLTAIEGKTIVPDRELITPFTHQTENLLGGRYPTCNFFCRKKDAKFSTEYRSNFREDSDLAFRLLDEGKQIAFCEKAIIYHPVLSGTYLTPIKLALRYQYDAILKKKFPKRYSSELDGHQLGPIYIPHLRKKIYLFYVVWVMLIIFLYFSLNGVQELNQFLMSVFLLLGLLALAAVYYLLIRQCHFNRKRIPLFLLSLPLACVLPFVFTFALVKGEFMRRIK